ncbi:uncharacterized protein [Paramisgurnus dabryanus]|uniref:uncharacterized protein n=1 Tax=Paramisgurnus dabryanus TaxID=90735 RepID=UPI003CCF990A
METPNRLRTTKVKKHHPITLGPAPLFRTVGLTGLSASLPPHRRLRTVVHKTLNTSTASCQSDDQWTRRPSRWFSSDSTVSRGPRIHQPHTNSLSVLTGQTETQEKRLPNVGVKKISSISQKQISPRTQRVKDKEMFINKHPLMVNVSHWDYSGKQKTRNTSPVRQKEWGEYMFEEVWRGESQKFRRTRTKRINRDEVFEVSDISQRIQGLEITDTQTETHKHPMGFKPRGRGNRAVPLGKEEGQTRRDRRPHFLPPITQSDCLLNVPLVLPDNSPPPSPCSQSDILFFPLSVPLPTFPSET